MPYNHYFNALTNTSGDSLIGYFARVVETGAGSVVPIYSDNNGTPISVVSGVTNMAKTDEYGNISLYVDPGTYNLDIYAPDAATFRFRVPNVAMNSTKGDKGDQGDQGPVGTSDNTYTTLATFKASDINRKVARLVGASGITDGSFNWTLGNFTGQADDLNIIKADSTALSVGAWVRQDANGSTFTYPVPTARRRRWAEVSSKTPELSGFTGADTSGATDSYAAVQEWLARAADRKGEAVIDGGFRVSLNGRPPLRITTPLTIKGAKHITSNATSLSSHDSGLYFDQDAPESIVVDDGGQLTIDRAVILGPSRVSTYPGIKTAHVNCALRLCGGALVQGWQIGVKYESGYYHRIHDATIVDCVTGIQVSAPAGSGIPAIYNLVIDQLKFDMQGVAGSTCMAIFNGSQVAVSQSSFESFTGNGIVLVDSSLMLTQSYFEGFGGWNVLLGNYGRIVALGNNVWLHTGANRWISVEGGSTVGAQVISRGNTLAMPNPGDNQPIDVYAIRNDDPQAFSDIGGDIPNQLFGPNARYMGAGFTGGMGPSAGRGVHSIHYPTSHPRAQHPISTVPLYMAPAQGPFASPDQTMILPFAMNAADQDPSGLRSQWGNNPVQMVWHQSSAVPGGQWEKVGLLLPLVAPPSGGSVVDVEARAALASLIDGLRKQAAMKNA